jgi:hypothetical protein
LIILLLSSPAWSSGEQLSLQGHDLLWRTDMAAPDTLRYAKIPLAHGSGAIPVDKTPAQVVLAWAVQRGTALLTTSTTPRYIRENFAISALPEDAMQEIRDAITTRVRFNTVVETGVPGFIPRGA